MMAELMIVRKLNGKLIKVCREIYVSSIIKRHIPNIIFIHINKTGGTSIEKALRLPLKNHLTAKEIIGLVGINKWDSSYKFASVRNPWGKIVSQYKYRIKTNQTRLSERNINFKQWLKKCFIEKDINYYDNPKLFLPQVEWLKDYENIIKIDKILRFEKLNSDFKSLALSMNLDKELPVLNQTIKTDYKTFYDDETREMIASHYHEDIELFKYRFDE